MRPITTKFRSGLSWAARGARRWALVARGKVRQGIVRVMIGLAGPYARILQRVTHGNEAYDVFARHGFHLLRKHYYLPIPDEQDLKDRLVREPSDCVGIDMNEEQALRLLDETAAKYQEEFRNSFPLHDTENTGGFHLVNGGFMAGDAHIYYALIRERRPRRIVEIGGGSSSQLAAAACLRNLEQYGAKPHLTVVEPYPGEKLKAGFPGLDRLLVQRVQDVDMYLFTSLEAGDICFIDSTHVLRPGGDVQLEYCELLPRLKPGVLVHIHDISLPKPYTDFYFKNHLYWNEQYLLQAFLTYNERFEVIWPGTDMFMKHPERLMRIWPEIQAMREKFPLAEPSSFWIRVRPAAAAKRAA